MLFVAIVLGFQVSGLSSSSFRSYSDVSLNARVLRSATVKQCARSCVPPRISKGEMNSYCSFHPFALPIGSQIPIREGIENSRRASVRFAKLAWSCWTDQTEILGGETEQTRELPQAGDLAEATYTMNMRDEMASD